MMKQKDLVPKKRFAGFTEKWNSKRMEELASFSKGKGYSKRDLISFGSPIILYGHLYTDYKSYIQTVKTYATKKENSVISQGNEVIVPSSGETAEDIARASAVGISGVILAGDLNIIKPNPTIDSLFLGLNISNSNLQRELIKRVQGSSVVHLYNSDIEEVNLSYPTLKEQQKIGQFFTHLDEMITLEQRKIDKTKALKSAYLAEMFPADGERLPKRRFAGFTDDWKLFKLKDLIVSEEKGRARADMIGNESTYLDASYLNGGEKLTVESPSNVNPEDVLILWDGSQAGKVYHGFKGALGSTLKALQPIESGSFIYYYLFCNQKKIFEQYRTPNIPHVINTFTDEFMISKPSLDEQLKIGDFLKKIDNIITTHQRKLDKLKATKQAYLHEMFV